MLSIEKNLTLSGVSKIGDEPVAYMSATISTTNNGNASVSKNISNQELYAANKVQVRADMAEFEQEVYKTEDLLNAPA